MTLIYRSFVASILTLALLSSPALAKNAERKCESLEQPFITLSLMTLDPAVGNPPRVSLCHRLGNAVKHKNKGRTDKAIAELRKYIAGVEGGKGKRIPDSYAKGLVAEARRVIAQLAGTAPSIPDTVTGVVYSYDTKAPAIGATVTLRFLDSSLVYTSHTDQDGTFIFDNLPADGLFIIKANTLSGEVGTSQDSLLRMGQPPTVAVIADDVGAGTIKGLIVTEDGEALGKALVTAVFPDTGRRYYTSTDGQGSYQITNVQPDGTVIVIGFKGSTGAVASTSSVLSGSDPTLIVNLSLKIPDSINPELQNAGFSAGLEGWETAGIVELVDRQIFFDTPQ